MDKHYDSVQELLPTDGWLGQYVELTNGLSACPRFRFFAAACVMGAAIHNKISLQRGTTGTLFPKFFPNPWILLLAGPGRGYKTSTINMACNCLRKACSDVRILADKITPEAIVHALSAPSSPKEMIRIGPRDATGLIKAPELSVFFGKTQYNTALVSLITDLYDFRETWAAETIGRGKNILKNNCLSILGGSTPTWLQHMLPEDAFTGGFMSRFIIVEMPFNYYKRIAEPKEPTPEQWAKLIGDLTDISRMEGDMKWGKGTRDIYRDIYESYMPTGDPQLDAYKEREAEQILRLAMLLSLSQGNMTLGVNEFTLSKQILYSLEAETNPRIERLSTHPRMALTQQILDVIRSHEPISEQQLLKIVYRQLSLGERQFYEALSLLRKTNQISVERHINEFLLSLTPKVEEKKK